MADGLSIAASVIAVVQLAGSCLKLAEKWLGPSEFSSSDLTAVKTTLHGFLEASIKFETRLSALKPDNSRQGTLECLPQVLERCIKALDIVQSFMNNRGFIGKHVVAPRFDGKLKASLKALEAAKELFMFALHADNQTILLHTQQCISRFAEDSSLFQESTTNILKRLHEDAEEEGRERKKFREDSRMFQDNAMDSLKRLEEDVSKVASAMPVEVAGKPPSLSEQQKNDVMESLRFDQIEARQVSIKKAHAKTCKWVLDNCEYKHWLDSSKPDEHCGFIWIKGKPGAGKSTLMKYLLVQARKKMKAMTIISFFFNARGGALEKSTVGMYRSLVFQLLTQHPELQHVLASIGPASLNGSPYEWHLEPLKALFEEAIGALAESSLVCFIDALDECDESEIRDMISFFESLGGSATSMKIQFRVCFSSRHYPHITIARGLSLILEGQEGHTQDITNYVETELKIGHSKLAQLVRTDLREKAQGVFMWVVLVVEILNKEHDRGNIHKLRKRLQDIPGDLHKLFRSILTRDDEEKDMLLLCIQWVLFSREPLKPEQLYFAIFSDSEPEILSEWDDEEVTPTTIQRFIVSSSKGLVEIMRSKIQTVQFIHESVRDFLLKSNGLQEIWPDLGGAFEGKSHERLKQCCLNQLTIDIATPLKIDGELPKASTPEAKELRQSANKKFPFLEYSTHNVLYHADLAGAGGVRQAPFLQTFKLADWIKLNNLFEQRQVRRYVAEVSLLYILAELNLASLIWACPSKQSCFEVEKSRFGLPLFAAFSTKSKQAVIALLEAEAHAQPENSLLQDVARKYSNGEGNRMVLSREFKFVREKSALHFAAECGDTEMLALLLSSSEANIDSKDKLDRTPLILAAQGGHKAAVELLLEKGAKTKSKNSSGETPLMLASCNSSEGIVKILLGNGANIEAKDSRGWTPLMLASYNGSEGIVKILLGNGADIETKDREGWTPLIVASRNSSEGIVKMLLGNGANIEAKDSRGWTPLMLASRNSSEGIVKMLLGNGANIEAKNSMGRTALILASINNSEGIVKMLLGNGADIEAKDSMGRTPLILASCNSSEGIVKMLLGNGANIEAKDSEGWTPLLLASRIGSADIVKLLLERGASIDTRNLSLYKPPRGMWEAAYQLILKKAKEQTGLISTGVNGDGSVTEKDIWTWLSD